MKSSEQERNEMKFWDQEKNRKEIFSQERNRNFTWNPFLSKIS